jgi:NAD(P)-dependent dehydrogenase (short-subunit alcohol dehydrogenase family)
MQRLKDKVCIVTGSGNGIGKAIAELFAREGGKVVCASRRESNGRPVSDALNADGCETAFVKCDVSVEEDVKHLFDETVRLYGRVDVLVNNAGVNFVKPFLDVEVEDWDRVINTDLRGTFMCVSRCCKEMVKTGGGSIVNITSVHTLQGVDGAAPYDAAKCGVVGMTRSIASELGEKGIRINCLSPGLIATQIWNDLLEASENRQECEDYWNENIPMRRPGKPEEIAHAALFLASDEASYFNGANILCDGGMTSALLNKATFESSSCEGGERK